MTFFLLNNERQMAQAPWGGWRDKGRGYLERYGKIGAVTFSVIFIKKWLKIFDKNNKRRFFAPRNVNAR